MRRGRAPARRRRNAPRGHRIPPLPQVVRRDRATARTGRCLRRNTGPIPRSLRKLTALVRVGEQTNRLPEMLRRQGETLTEELEYAIRRMGAMLEPALILLVGILVAVILIAMYMPMFSLGGIMG